MQCLFLNLIYNYNYLCEHFQLKINIFTATHIFFIIAIEIKYKAVFLFVIIDKCIDYQCVYDLIYHSVVI